MIASVGLRRTKLQLLHAICGVRETPLFSANAETAKPLAANSMAAKIPMRDRARGVAKQPDNVT